MTTDKCSPLVRLVSKFVKYFLLGLVGLAIAYVFSACFGVSHFTVMLLPFVLDWVARSGIILFCLMAIVVIIESVR